MSMESARLSISKRSSNSDLAEPRDQRALRRPVGALDGGDAGVGERLDHLREPVPLGDAVGVGEQDDPAARQPRTVVPGGGRAAVGLGDDGHRKARGDRGGGVGRAVVDDQHLVLLPRHGLPRERLEAGPIVAPAL